MSGDLTEQWKSICIARQQMCKPCAFYPLFFWQKEPGTSISAASFFFFFSLSGRDPVSFCSASLLLLKLFLLSFQSYRSCMSSLQRSLYVYSKKRVVKLGNGVMYLKAEMSSYKCLPEECLRTHQGISFQPSYEMQLLEHLPLSSNTACAIVDYAEFQVSFDSGWVAPQKQTVSIRSCTQLQLMLFML